MEQNKNYAKRVPTSMVLTLRAEDDVSSLSSGEPAGLLEGNVMITRAVLIVTEAFGVGAGLVLKDNTADGYTQWFNAPIDVVGVFTSPITLPVGGTIAPIYRALKTLWEANLTTAGNQVDGELMVVVEYVQLDTEPGLHSATTKEVI